MKQIIISKSMNTGFEKGKVLSKFVIKTRIMLTTIKGIYDNGKIILTEEPPVTTKADVMATFLPTEESKATHGKQKIF